MYHTNPMVETRRHAQSVLYLAIITSLLLLLYYPHAAHAQDKSGVKPQVISLPSGPGSIEGLGETFEPDLSSGTASFPVKFTAAPGRAGLQPELELAYNGGNGNGPWGMGWKLSIPSIQRRTENGLPSYDDSKDEFIYNDGEKLVPLADGSYRFENEGRFMRFRRLAGGGWEAHAPDGMRYLFGESENSRVVTPQGIFRWELARQIDPNGNELVYSYQHDGGFAYPSAIHYNQGATEAESAVIFHYAPRPDPFTDRRSGAPITQARRGVRLEMTALGKLVRAYNFAYAPEQSTGKYSLLISVTQVGDDGTSTLPPHQFTYTQFDPSQSAVVTMQNPPPLGLTNPDADLVDINADGLPDLAYTAAEGHRFYLNRGRGRWQAEPIYPAQSPPERISSPNVRMADMNGDGRVDLLVKAGATGGAPFYYYTNNDDGEWEKDGRVDFGPSPGFDLNDPNVQLIDVNNDHRIDVVLSTAGRLKIWLARDGAWSPTADFDVPAPAAGDAAKFSDPNIKVGDITGDRMEDLLFVREGQVVYWAHNGNGSYAEGETLLNPPAGIGTQSAQIQAGDLNNDGLVDLVLPGNRTVYYWLSLGDGSLTAPIVLRDMPPFNAEDTAVRLADIDGDGAVELLYSRYPAPANEAMQYVDFSVGAQPFLLQSVDNGLGRTIQIDYKSSVADYIADWDAETPWQVNLPFPVQVVRQVKVHDANSGDDYVIDYHYRDGYYDGVQKEFRGFVRSEEIKRGDPTAPTLVTRHTYDVGMVDESRKGMLLAKEVLAAGGACTGTFVGCFERTVNQLTTLVVVEQGQTKSNKPIAYAYVSQADRFVHEQQAQPVQLRQTYEQDSYGNLTKEFNYGQLCGPEVKPDLSCGDDELLKYTDYAYNLDAWLLNRPQRVYQTDEAGAFVSEQRFYYDGEAYVGLGLGEITRGQLMRQEGNLGPTAGNRMIALKRHTYDQYGNIIGIMDANGNRTTVEYDAQLHTFPVLEQLHLNDGNVLSYAAIYHPGLGKPMAATDYNGQPLFFIYDTFSRLHKIVEPGDTLELPTQQFSYAIGSPRSAITTEQRIRSGELDVLTSVSYFDGLGRKLQTRREAADNKVVVEEAVTYNARQSVYQQFQPYYASSFAYQPPPADQFKTTLTYDALGRVIRTENPDGSYTSTRYQPLARIQADEEDNRADSPHVNTPTTLVYDGLERLISVEEVNLVNWQPTAITTRYAYDLQGNLTQMIDGQGNTRVMGYDGLGRKLRLQEPNRGTIAYTYDDNGNLIRTVDAKGQVVETQYDAANRPVRETLHYTDGRPTQVNAIYHYDGDLDTRYPGAQNTLGRLAYIEDQAGTIHYSYDARGNVSASLRHFDDEDYTFVTRSVFDAMNRLTKVIYPDGTALDYAYDAGGLLQRIPGVIENIQYTPANQRANITYANGVVSRYGYDARLRLTALQTLRGSEPLQQLGYTFDGVSNLLSIADTRPATGGPASIQNQIFGYDALYRLTSAGGTYGQIEYGYDAIGNLLHKVSNGAPDDPSQNLGELRYGENGAGPHALTSAGDVTYRYDANGNLVSDGRRRYTWNAKDQLVTTDMGSVQTSYTYNAEGQRVRQTVRLGAAVSSTLYVGENVEVRDDRLIFYIFDDEERIAQISKSFEPTTLLSGFASPAPGSPPPPAALQWYLSDHLGSTNLLLDAQGAVLREQVYYPYGPLRYRLNPGPVDYGYAGKELDHSGLHYFGGRYYDANTGHFISVDPVVQEYGGNPQQNEALLNYLTHPQMANGYSYAAGSPLKYIDPDGREIVISKALRQTPGFMKAWKLFKSTHEGQRLIASLEKSGWTVHLRGNLGGRDAKSGLRVHDYMREMVTTGDYNPRLKATEAVGLINIRGHKDHYRTKDQLIFALGDTIHRQLRQVEAVANDEATFRTEMFLQDLQMDQYNDTYAETLGKLSAEPETSTEPHNVAFKKELRQAMK